MTFPALDEKTFVGDHGQDSRIADHPPGGAIDPDNRRPAGSASTPEQNEADHRDVVVEPDPGAAARATRRGMNDRLSTRDPVDTHIQETAQNQTEDKRKQGIQISGAHVLSPLTASKQSAGTLRPRLGGLTKRHISGYTRFP